MAGRIKRFSSLSEREDLLTFYLIVVSSRPQEYFTCATAANIIEGGNLAMSGENPRPSASC